MYISRAIAPKALNRIHLANKIQVILSPNTIYHLCIHCTTYYYNYRDLEAKKKKKIIRKKKPNQKYCVILILIGERPFQCVTCLKTFTQKCALTLHTRIHTGSLENTLCFCFVSALHLFLSFSLANQSFFHHPKMSLKLYCL